MACTCNLHIQEAEEELEFWVNQNYMVKPCLKKMKEGKRGRREGENRKERKRERMKDRERERPGGTCLHETSIGSTIGVDSLAVSSWTNKDQIPNIPFQECGAKD